MVAFAPADLPSSIDSVEKLAVWSTMVLNHLHPDITVVEAPGQAQLAATAAPFYITASDPKTWRHLSRISIALSANWQRGSQKYWTYAQPLSGQTIPAEFKS